jgi:hypothetical protein
MFMMIDKLNLSTYNQMARISQSLNKFIREALITKSQINTSYESSSLIKGIGDNINILV